MPVPVNVGTNPPVATFDHALTIYATNGTIGPYPLPAYIESKGTAVKVALTPFTAAADLTVVGLILGVIALAHSDWH